MKDSNMTRRNLIFRMSFSLALFATLLVSPTLGSGETGETLQPDEKTPNILWLSTEDIGPQLSCYGDTTAPTPNLDALAKKGVVYDLAWSNYPVCAPARTTIITGMYAAANGAGNMRSMAGLPKDVKMFPQYLREAGYYCTNKSKEDYNHEKPKGVWDQSSRKASWTTRKKNQPFFAVVNHTGTHESKIRKRPHEAIIDPTTVPLTPYWPDIPEVRQDVAQYYDNLIRMDKWIGDELKKLEESGEADNTIVVFFGDHGSGMPRHKRYAGDSGMRVPLVVYIPEKLKAKHAPKEYQNSDRSRKPVGFVDFAPSMLSVAGIEAPEYMQGNAFIGTLRTEGTVANEILFGFRDRMDEKPDFSRSLREGQYLYVRNFMPHLPAGQWLDYQQKTPTTAKWYEMFQQDKLNEIQSQFWKPRVAEELYDLKADPHETNNLSESAAHQDRLKRFRKILKTHTHDIRDLGFVHEGRLQEITEKGKQTRRDFALSEEYNLIPILKAASAVGIEAEASDPKTIARFAAHADPTVRYWTVMELLNRSPAAAFEHRELIINLLDDAAPEVAMTAAETLIRNSADQDEVDEKTQARARQVVVKYCDLNNSNHCYALTALNIVDRHRSAFKDEMEQVLKVPTKVPGAKRGGDYLQRMVVDLKEER